MPRWSGYMTSDETKRKIAEAHTIHGHTQAPKGSPEKRTFESWAQMRKRCLCKTDAAYPSYGGRGITICPEWSDYLIFVQDMGLRPEGMSIDRIDNNSNYDKSNCRWATKQDQSRNRRSNKVLTVGGVSKTLAQWAEETGLPSSTIRMRITRGFAIAESILSPSLRKRG